MSKPAGFNQPFSNGLSFLGAPCDGKDGEGTSHGGTRVGFWAASSCSAPFPNGSVISTAARGWHVTRGRDRGPGVEG